MPLECIAWLGLNSLQEFEGAEGVAVSATPLCNRCPHTHTHLHASLNSELKFNPPFHLGLKNTNACKLANFVLSLADPRQRWESSAMLASCTDSFLFSLFIFLLRLLFRSIFLLFLHIAHLFDLQLAHFVDFLPSFPLLFFLCFFDSLRRPCVHFPVEFFLNSLGAFPLRSVCLLVL